MALVTIGIPVYNEEKHLAETIESAISQNFKDIEIIISDNGSSDKTPEIIKDYSSRYCSIQPILHDRNRGPAANFWTLLDNTKSKYVVILGGHDLFLPDYVGDAVAFLESNPDYVMAYPQSKLVDGNDELLGYRDSDIDTSGLSVQQRMMKTVVNLSWCTCFHGVFRTDILRKCPTLPIQGADNLILFVTAYHGHIHFMGKLGILRRESRGETPEMVEKRRVAAGNYSATGSRFCTPLSVMSMEHILFVLEKTRLSLIDKVKLSISTALAFRRRYGVRLLSMIVAYSHRKWRRHS
jgi:glycosyltransferase involved in cell wall biosynthesis